MHPSAPISTSPRVGGTKNPRLDEVVALRPDVVLVNNEENRPDDIDELRRRGVGTLVTDYETVPDALGGLGALLEAARHGAAAMARRRRRGLGGAVDRTALDRRRADLATAVDGPWPRHVRGRRAGRVGSTTCSADDAERYPRIDLAMLPAHDVVVLPDEPYAFAADDGPDAFAAPCRLVSGRHLTWYGPSLAEARAVLAEQIWGADLGAAGP